MHLRDLLHSVPPVILYYRCRLSRLAIVHLPPYVDKIWALSKYVLGCTR